MKISVATRSQLEIVKDLAYKIWPSTYGSILSGVQLNFMLDKFYNLSYLENQLINENQVFLLIEENNKYLGFCAYELNCESSSKTKLHKIYVLPETQGKGIGKILLNEVEKITLENNNSALFLNVNRYNNAQEFYKKQGYSVIKTIDIEIGNGYLMEDFVMEKTL
ncbi:GNAT family N-acetyltransferase [Flavobacterium sp.]|uniref:GNAT family N-acetyltransferase n=1 Tax=Flavobacterium sp. TaxID=239 RepID=UPI003750D88F